MGLIIKLTIVGTILLILFVAGPVISSYDYYCNNCLYYKYPRLFSGGYNSDNDNITLLDNESMTSKISLRHELIHKDQNKKGQKNNLLNEFEAYLKQYYFWNKVNLTTLDWQDVNNTTKL